MKKKLLLIALGMMVVLAACAKAPEPAYESPAMPAPQAPSMDYGAAPGAREESKNYDQTGVVADAVAQERLVVRTAYMRVSVADPSQAMQDLSKLANEFGGFVVNSQVENTSYREGVAYTSSSITVRVPSVRLDEAMARIRAMAADAKTGVISESVTGEDVTAEFVDTESRLNNLKSAEKQLVELLDKAESLEYTLDIFRELTEIRSQIETLEGRVKYLKESAQLSAISVSFVAEASLQPIEIGGWKPEGVARDAIQALISGAQDLGTFLIWFVIAWLPFLLVLALVIYLIAKLVSKLRAKRRAKVKNQYYTQVAPVAVEPAVVEEKKTEN